MNGQDSSAQQIISEAADVGGAVRLFHHVKQNHIGYLVGLLVAFQIGVMEKLLTYGSGVCT